MLTKLFGTTLVQRLLLIGYCSLAIGLPLNKIVLSLATMLVALIVILDFSFTAYLDKIKRNKAIQFLLLFLVIHLVSIFWSDNISYFLKDLNSKLPFYVIPIVFVLKPLVKKNEFYWILGAFLFSLLITSIVNFSFYYFNNDAQNDARNMSLFLSHIRYGLMLIFGIVICFYWLINQKLKFKSIPCLLIFWFLVYTYFSEVFSAYLTLLLIVFVICIIYIKKLSSKLLKRIIYSTLLIFSGGFLFVFIYYFFIDVQVIPIPKKGEISKNGNSYNYEASKTTTINGTPVYTYVCGIELKKEWAKKSNQPIFKKNQSGFENYYILIQYMASKGYLKKDAETFNLLTNKDIKQIENGINNCCPDENVGFIKRLKTLREEIYEPDPNGKTIRQRIEYLKAGVAIFASQPIVGVGSGDIDDEFQSYYEKNKVHLKKENRLRTHNQILSYFISFGLIGGILFLYFLAISFQFFYKNNLTIAAIFLLILVISFFSEDTLETQMGATFFALFYGLFISSSPILNSQDEN